MSDQRARVTAATDRGIDLTLERNAWLATLRLRINRRRPRSRNSFKLEQIGMTFPAERK